MCSLGVGHTDGTWWRGSYVRPIRFLINRFCFLEQFQIRRKAERLCGVRVYSVTPRLCRDGPVTDPPADTVVPSVSWCCRRTLEWGLSLMSTSAFVSNPACLHRPTWTWVPHERVTRRSSTALTGPGASPHPSRRPPARSSHRPWSCSPRAS